MGHNIHEKPSHAAMTIIPSVGCPMGCNFCTTSSFFGGKGKFTNFYETGRELFDIMASWNAQGGARFSSSWTRTSCSPAARLELLALMQEHNKSWSFYVFASANALRQYTTEELVQLGVTWIWMAWSRPVRLRQTKGSDTIALTRELRGHGIKVLGSTIIGLEHHTPDNIKQEVEQAVAHDTEFHQFMLYTPIPGTPLYQGDAEQGACWKGWTWPTSTGSTSSTSGMPPFPARTRSASSTGPSSRFRTQRPQPLPRVPNHARRLAASAGPPRRPRSRAVRAGSTAAQECLPGGPLGHGAN